MEMLENLKNVKLSRDTKVNIAFGAPFASSVIATGGLSASWLLGSAASNLIGAEVVKGGLNFLNRRSEGEVKKAD